MSPFMDAVPAVRHGFLLWDISKEQLPPRLTAPEITGVRFGG